MHDMTPEQYRVSFPGHPMQCTETRRMVHEGLKAAARNRPPPSEETKKKIAEKSRAYHKAAAGDPVYLERQRTLAAGARNAKGKDYRHSEETKRKMRGPRPNSVGIPKSQEHRRKLSEARAKTTGWTHSEATKEKMRITWLKRKEDKEVYQAYLTSLKERMNTPDMISRLRSRMSVAIQIGKHNGKGRDTSLEKKFSTYLRENRIDFQPQHALSDQAGTFLFDFYVPSMNLLVETDGEYWHSKSYEQVNRDIIKEKKAYAAGYRFVRISDIDWKPEIMMESEQTIRAHNQEIIDRRLKKWRPD